jgi:hypothetical protein
MIKASAKGRDGRAILVIGLSFGNLDKFRAEPGETYIKIDGREMGMSSDVMIFSGATEADCAETIKGFVGPKTKTTVSGRLKN